MGVTVDAEHFENAVADIQDGYVKRAAAEVEDEEFFVFLFIQAVGESRSRGLRQHAQDIQSRDFTGVLGRLALGIIEVCRDGDHRFGDLFAQVIFCGLFQILQDEAADLFGGVVFAADADL